MVDPRFEYTPVMRVAERVFDLGHREIELEVIIHDHAAVRAIKHCTSLLVHR
jgi:hypothetical protein